MSFFISFEGPEGSGKSTHAELLEFFLKDQGLSVTRTREPGGSPIGEKIRTLLLDPDFDTMDAWTELFLYLAARRQHVSETIQPALDDGKIVITDRFADASVVYQGIARGLGASKVDELNQIATGGRMPDLTIILDVSTDEGLKKARTASNTPGTKDGDRIENETVEFHRNVREAYYRLAEDEPDRCVIIERDGSIDEIQTKIRELVSKRMSLE